MSRLAQDADIGMLLGQAGRLRVLENYHLERNSDQLGKLLAPLAEDIC